MSIAISLESTMISVVRYLFQETSRAEIDVALGALPSDTTDIMGPAIFFIANKSRVYYSSSIVVNNLHSQNKEYKVLLNLQLK